MSDLKISPSLFTTLSNRIILRPEDRPFLVCLLQASSIFITAVALFIFPSYSFFILLVHILIYLKFIGSFITAYHDINHYPLFKNRRVNQFIIHLFGTIYGMTPYTYFCHHIIMHHPEDNGQKDLSSTRPYQRDSLRDFCKYYAGFIFCLFGLANYLKSSGNKEKRRLANWMIFSELTYIAITVACLFINIGAAFAIFIIPTLVTRSFLIVGNWGEHAFIDINTPSNVYRNTTNILGKYNRRWFNVGFHIGHHIHPTKHYSLLEEDFEENIQTYAKEDAVIFRDLHFPHIWYYLMTKNYQKLAKRYVRLPGHEGRSDAEVIQLLKSRVQAIPQTSSKLVKQAQITSQAP